MELVPYGEGDLWLTEALELDPDVMHELGGPRPREELVEVHAKRLAAKIDGEDWWFKIVPEPGGEAVGTIGIWPSEAGGESAYETGWMILPAHQGRGTASAALGMLLDRARRRSLRRHPRLPRCHERPLERPLPEIRVRAARRA